MADSPLRHHGVYRFRGHTYSAISLASGPVTWQVTALIGWPAGRDGPSDMLYLRHRDHVLVSSVDFEPIGTLADLEDTGETDDDREDA